MALAETKLDRSEQIIVDSMFDSTVDDIMGSHVPNHALLNLVLIPLYVISSNVYNDLLLVPLPFENILYTVQDIFDPGIRE
eukprot:g35944.t1